VLPHFLKKITKNIFPKFTFIALSSLVVILLLFPAYLNANRLGEPDLWKTPLQAFVDPIFDEYRQTSIEPEALKAFKFESPFSRQNQSSVPMYSFQPQKYNIIIYLMEGDH
jgi:hypothetical protein